MRTLLLSALFTTLLAGSAVYAQDKPSTPATCAHHGKGACKGQSNQCKSHSGQQKGQNFIDANKDGVCDHKADGTGPMRKRDGSCGQAVKKDAPAKK